MCKVYNISGSLNTIGSHLEKYNINDFNSLGDITYFRKNYSNQRQEIISSHEFLIEEEKNILSAEIEQLGQFIDAEKEDVKKKLLQQIDLVQNKLKIIADSIPSNIFKKSFKAFKIFFLKYKIRNDVKSLTHNINYAVRRDLTIFSQKSNRQEFINGHYTKAVEESAAIYLEEIDRKKRVLDELDSFIWGAIGEEKVIQELKNLSDDYILINDLSVSFEKAIFRRHQNDYIKSIQIDHILIGPSGIFLIETKNWSEASLKNLNLYSPVEQIKRASFALYSLLHPSTKNSRILNLLNHHWGKKKIPVRNLIVLINQKPKEEFQFVKILTLKELLGYVNYFKPIFTNNETTEISNYLRKLANLTKVN